MTEHRGMTAAALGSGGFGLLYQPIRRLHDRAMVGVEALARFGHGLLLESACRQGAAWQRAGHNLLISVKLSPVRLGDATMAADVSDILHRTGCPRPGCSWRSPSRQRSSSTAPP